VGRGTIGRKLAELRDWLWGDSTKLRYNLALPTEQGRSRIRGIEVTFTAEHVLETARQALSENWGYPNRYESCLQEWKILQTCQCPACAQAGPEGLTASRIEGFCNRATHNLWVLLEEASWVERRLTSGTYREHDEDRLDNSTYKPLIAKAVEASMRTFGNVN
jgi:hypothetical protein